MVDHPAARALTGYLLVRGGVHQVAYARAVENLTGANLMKLFPAPRIPTEKIPECRPHIERGDHLRLYRFSPNDYRELAAVFNGPHPETGEDLVVIDEAPEGEIPRDLPPSRRSSHRTTRPRTWPRSRASSASGRASHARRRASSPKATARGRPHAGRPSRGRGRRPQQSAEQETGAGDVVVSPAPDSRSSSRRFRARNRSRLLESR